MRELLLTLALLQAPVSGGMLRGIVLNSAGETISSARVELTGSTQGALVTRTDGRGQFVFANLPAGRYRVAAKKEGFVRQEYGEKRAGGDGSVIVLEAGTSTPTLSFRLQPAPTIAGAVRNEDGIPIAHILVQSLRRSYGVRGNRIVTVFSNVLTDDLGAYRLYWLDPGDYYVNASYLPQLPTPVNANEDAPRASYAPTYYPGFSNAADANAVRVEGGNVFAGIDFKLKRAPAVKVRGTIYSILTGAPVPAAVTLMAPEESGSTARYGVQTDASGVFEMKGVNPGSYVLAARTLAGDGQLGFSSIVVTGVDYSKGDVVVGPGMSVSARLFGEAPPNTDLRTTRVSLLPLETFVPAASASAQPDGALTVANVQPGYYMLRVSGLPDSAYVSAARAGPRDILERFVLVEYENRPAPLEIQLAFDGGSVSGTAGEAGQGFDRVTVVLVPDRARRHRPDQYRVASPDASGKFSIAGIPPGEYKLFAWDSIEPNAWVNPDFLLGYEQVGIPALVGPNEKLSAQIRVIPAAR